MAGKIKVLFLEAGRRGGSVFRLRGFLDRLDRERFEMGFLAYYDDMAVEKLFAVQGLYCAESLGVRRDPQPDTFKHILGYPIRTPFFFRYRRAMVRVLAEYRPDVVYLNTSVGGHEPAIQVSARERVPIVAHLRMTRPMDADELRHAPLVERFITLSDCGKRLYQDQLAVSDACVTHIYDGLDIGEFDRRTLCETAPHLPAGRINVCLAGTLNDRKRPLLAIEAFSHALKLCPTLSLFVAGTGPLMEPLRRAVQERGLGDQVHLLGFVAGIPAMLKKCAVGLLVSEREGVPNSVMEYMAAGLPSVVVALPGIDEIVHDRETGLIVQEACPIAIGKALASLGRSASRRECMGNAARRLIEQHRFSVRQETLSVQEVIEEVVQSHRAARKL